MAKEQNLSLNPTKISGICGRLMCCLKYESQICEDCVKAVAPKINTMVVTERGEGLVVSVNRREQSARVQLRDANTITISWDEAVEKPQSVVAIDEQ